MHYYMIIILSPPTSEGGNDYLTGYFTIDRSKREGVQSNHFPLQTTTTSGYPTRRFETMRTLIVN